MATRIHKSQSGSKNHLGHVIYSGPNVTTSSSNVAFPTMSLTVTPTSARDLLITFTAGNFYNAAGVYGYYSVVIWKGPIGTGTAIGSCQFNGAAGSTLQAPVVARALDLNVSTATTYNIAISASAGTLGIECSGNRVAILTVEEL